MANKILGVLLIILGIYISIWLMLIGGIVQAVNSISPFDATNLAIGIIKVIFAGVGFLPGYLGIYLVSRWLNMNFQLMSREKIKEYYENKIDDIADKTKREELLDKLDEIDTLLHELDGDIDEELEKQEDNYIEDEIQDDYNYYREVLNQWIYTKSYLIYK